MTARVHLALLVLAIVVLVAGGLVAFFLWRPQSHHSIQVNRQAQVQVPPRARRLVPEVSEKDKSRLAAAARRVPLGSVMHWYGQQRFIDPTAPGTKTLPSDCLQEAQSDPKLAKWLEKWKTGITDGTGLDPGDRENLSNILKQTKLSSLAMIDIGRAVFFLGDDEATTARFFASAGLHAAKDADDVKSNALRYRMLLLALNSTRPFLWDIIDNGDHIPVAGLKASCDVIAKWQPNSGDRVLDSDCTFAMIDSAECLYLEGKYDQTLAILNEVYKRDLTDRQQLAANWPMGFTLSAVKRYDEAIPYLQGVCEAGNKHREAGLLLLCKAGISAKRVDVARDAFEKFKKLRSAHDSLTDQLAAELAHAERDSQGS